MGPGGCGPGPPRPRALSDRDPAPAPLRAPRGRTGNHRAPRPRHRAPPADFRRGAGDVTRSRRARPEESGRGHGSGATRKSAPPETAGHGPRSGRAGAAAGSPGSSSSRCQEAPERTTPSLQQSNELGSSLTTGRNWGCLHAPATTGGNGSCLLRAQLRHRAAWDGFQHQHRARIPLS